MKIDFSVSNFLANESSELNFVSCFVLVRICSLIHLLLALCSVFVCVRARAGGR